MKKEVQETIKKYEKYAQEKGFKLNPNKEVVENIVELLLKKEKDLGARYCPCRRLSENKEKNKEIICPCKFHLEEIEKNGQCHCFLFVK